MVNIDEINSVLKNLNNTYFSTGFKNLDEAVKLDKNGSLVLISAPPSMGKTSFILSIIENIAPIKEKILLFSCEESKESILRELIFRKCEIPINNYYRNNLTENDIKTIELNSDEIKNWNISFEDNAGIMQV